MAAPSRIVPHAYAGPPGSVPAGSPDQWARCLACAACERDMSQLRPVHYCAKATELQGRRVGPIDPGSYACWHYTKGAS